MATLSVDLRERILAAYDNKEGTRQEIADRFKVSLGMVKKLLQQRRHTGDISPRHHRSGRKPVLIQHHREQLRKMLAKNPDLTLEEMRNNLGVSCTIQAVHYVLADMKLTYKKKTLRASEQDRPDIAKGRKRWRRLQPSWDPARLVFLDESGAKTNMTRLRGRAIKGERVHASAPHGHWYTTTMISSIRLDGLTTCMAVDSATDRDVFYTYIERVLYPTLRPGDILVMDNLGAHKAPSSLALIESAGATPLFLPPYSPDLNPIEKMWSKVKQLLRGAEARTQLELIAAMKAAFEKVSPRDAMNWFASFGYSFI